MLYACPMQPEISMKLATRRKKEQLVLKRNRPLTFFILIEKFELFLGLDGIPKIRGKRQLVQYVKGFLSVMEIYRHA